jgi:hypothetical protein
MANHIAHMVARLSRGKNHRRHEQRQPRRRETQTARSTFPPSPPWPTLATDITFSPATTAGRKEKHGFSECTFYFTDLQQERYYPIRACMEQSSSSVPKACTWVDYDQRTSPRKNRGFHPDKRWLTMSITSGKSVEGKLPDVGNQESSISEYINHKKVS